MVCLEDAHKMSLTAQKWETYRFTSKEFDRETGLYYYGARYYEPKLSNWMSADPAGFELINPMDSEGKLRKGYNIVEALNWYAYAGNNPVIFVDPTGMKIKIKGSRKFRKAVKAALNTIKSMPKGNELVSKLEDSDNKHIITETEDDNSIDVPADYKEGKGSGSTINFNPDDMEGGKNEEGSTERPPFVGLGHELGHAEAFDDGTQSLDMGTGEAGTTPPSEENSMRRENEIRSEHGLPRRPSYY